MFLRKWKWSEKKSEIKPPWPTRSYLHGRNKCVTWPLNATFDVFCHVFFLSTSLCCSYIDVHDLRAQFLSMFRVRTDPMIADGRKKRVESNQGPFDLRTVIRKHNVRFYHFLSSFKKVWKQNKEWQYISATVEATEIGIKTATIV